MKWVEKVAIVKNIKVAMDKIVGMKKKKQAMGKLPLTEYWKFAGKNCCDGWKSSTTSENCC